MSLFDIELISWPQFELFRQTTELFSTSWPLIDINDNPANTGNAAGAWQYGVDFGGGSYK